VGGNGWDGGRRGHLLRCEEGPGTGGEVVPGPGR
jgi:hypothetical protein